MKTTRKFPVKSRLKKALLTLIPVAAIVWMGVFLGCQRVPSTQAAEGMQVLAEPTNGVDESVKQTAIAAKDALFKRLSGRLKTVIKADGPAAAISVCSTEAPLIATRTGKEQGVTMGRTSFRLRNAKNTPPGWAKKFVSQRTAQPQFVPLPNGGTGALLPIQLKAECLICHGPAESIAADIRAKLSEVYPKDEATGFKEGDLRGWVWVEVPATASSKQQRKTQQKKAGTTKQKKGQAQGRGLGRGKGRGGMGRGMGRGPGGNPEMRADMTTLHAMFADRSKIKRTVKLLPKGAVAVTESDDRKIAKLLQEHVPAMENRVHDNEPLPPMTFHPIFVELIKHADDYTLNYEATKKGMKVTYEADDPFVIMLVQEHAKLVSRFIKNGMAEIHKPYKLPKVKARQAKPKAKVRQSKPSNQSKQDGKSSAGSQANSLGIAPPLPAQVKSPADNPATFVKVELGKKLFFDPRLSLTGTVSCNSCHNVMEGGDDGRPSSMGIHGRLGPRNAPTVWNSAFQASQFWDGRSPSLEDQAKGPIVAGPEMGMPNHAQAVERIASISGYRTEFARVFGDESSVNIDNVAKAIAAFERTLTTPNSPYDRYARGDKKALNTQQVRGMKLFDNVGCTECHSGPAFNGWEVGDHDPAFEEFPRFTEIALVKRWGLAKDLGRFEATKQAEDKHYFKVPTLRNITITAPYFHNGAVESLSDAVRVMAEAELDTELSSQEIADIVEFLKSLEGAFPEITLPRLPSRSGQSVLDNQQPAATIHEQD